MNNTNNTNNTNINININVDNLNNQTFVCDYCYKKYNVVAKVTKTDTPQIPQCYECLFFFNYGNMNVLNGSCGLSLIEFVALIASGQIIHDIPCERLSDAGGCYICMYLLDIPIEGLTDKKEEIKKEESKELIINITQSIQDVVIVNDSRLNDVDFLTI